MEFFSKWIDVVFKVWILMLTGFACDNPEWIGEWQAQKDIAYDSIWSEWVMDCDCTEEYVE